jgi:hypothetical protein
MNPQNVIHHDLDVCSAGKADAAVEAAPLLVDDGGVSGDEAVHHGPAVRGELHRHVDRDGSRAAALEHTEAEDLEVRLELVHQDGLAQQPQGTMQTPEGVSSTFTLHLLWVGRPAPLDLGFVVAVDPVLTRVADLGDHRVVPRLVPEDGLVRGELGLVRSHLQISEVQRAMTSSSHSNK